MATSSLHRNPRRWIGRPPVDGLSARVDPKELTFLVDAERPLAAAVVIGGVGAEGEPCLVGEGNRLEVVAVARLAVGLGAVRSGEICGKVLQRPGPARTAEFAEA